MMTINSLKSRAPSSGRPLMVWGYHASWHGDMNRAILDELAPDIPLAVWQRSTHEMYFNSLAIEQLEITEDYVQSWGSALAIDIEHVDVHGHGGRGQS